MIYDFEGQTPKIDPNSWAAPNSVIIGRVELKKNSNIWFNTTLRGDLEPIIIGENSNIQDGSVIHTDPGCPTIVGNGVTVAPMIQFFPILVLFKIVEPIPIKQSSAISQP